MTQDLPSTACRSEVDAFLAKHAPATTASALRGRLIVAIDATGSRQPTWDIACGLQGEMFDAVAEIGMLDAQLVFYRGRERQASRWVSDGRALAKLMTTITCNSGYTQIGKVLSHARRENACHKVNALVFVGDAMKEIPAQRAGIEPADISVSGRPGPHGNPNFPTNRAVDERRVLPVQPK